MNSNLESTSMIRDNVTIGGNMAAFNIMSKINNLNTSGIKCFGYGDIGHRRSYCKKARKKGSIYQNQ